MVELGQRVRDKVSGFEGIVVGRAEWLNGCVRCELQPMLDKEGKLPEAQWIDEPQLEVIGKAEILIGMKAIRGVFDMSPGTINKLIKEQGFPARNVGGRLLALRAEIMKWIETGLKEND